MTLVKWNPNRVLFNWNDTAFDRLFNARNFYGDGLYPQVDIEEDDNAYVVNMDLPGMTKDDIRISYQEGVLSISGERKNSGENSSVSYHLNERRYGKFERAFRVHSDINADKIQAEFRNGVLRVELPKSDAAKPKQISVNVK